ncbi:T9SS type A sorting domain-containing protein [Winogradskyella sp. UBA3174]|uniref:T9SS type A sorting domain-containing protein n=1 Tax=Winogradskyella sp. UBA3174 TaxID=1947785 RepID=UPI0025E7A285|nr:T9SS type A sorting domain-containing protein [Winogradskyella sp. UBA3174]|tara:strand:+ start:18778 stop:20238 length:1461 start_codon:yes stop_codon:yes gene_type:complete
MRKLIYLLILIPFLALSQVQIGQDIDGSIGDEFGWSVRLSSSSKYIAIGSIGSSSGYVSVYENISGVWTQVGQNIEGEAAGDWSGWSVSISSDGSIVAIGGIFNDGVNGVNSGHVRIYENILGVWTQIGQDIDGEAADDRSGWSVSLSSDGNTVAVGGIRNDGVNGENSGHVRIYENTSGVWTQLGQDIDGEASFDWFGYSLDLSSDASIVAIGTIFNAGVNGSTSGHVRIYENISGVWTQTGQDIDGDAVNDFFGRSLSISSDGSIVAIGAQQNDGNGSDSGHVKVYENISGVWTQIGQDIEGEAAINLSGYALSLSSNGSIVAIGAPFNDGNGIDSGQVRIYRNESSVWTQIGQDIDGEASDDKSGTSVSLSSDGSIVVIGASSNNGNGMFSGHVRVYDLSAALSTEEQTELKFNFYPNPAKTQFTIQLENSIELENVIIYNTLGQQVLTTKEIVINTAHLAPGIYTVELQTTSGKGSKKLIIE